MNWLFFIVVVLVVALSWWLYRTGNDPKNLCVCCKDDCICGGGTGNRDMERYPHPADNVPPHHWTWWA